MAESAQIVTFLFTQDLRGDLRFLPKLARVLMQLRLVEQRTLTLDLGGMCSPEVWHCAVTDGSPVNTSTWRPITRVPRSSARKQPSCLLPSGRGRPAYSAM